MNASSASLSVSYPPGTACRKLSNPSFCWQISIYFRSKIIRRIGLTQIPVHIARLKKLSVYPSTLVIRLPNTIINIPKTIWIQPKVLTVVTKFSSSRPPDAPTWVCEATGRGCILSVEMSHHTWCLLFGSFCRFLDRLELTELTYFSMVQRAKAVILHFRVS